MADRVASIVGASGFVVSSGVYLKWAVAPVLAAYELGRLAERIRNARQKAAR